MSRGFPHKRSNKNIYNYLKTMGTLFLALLVERLHQEAEFFPYGVIQLRALAPESKQKENSPVRSP